MTTSPVPDPDHNAHLPAGSAVPDDLAIAVEVVEALRDDPRLTGVQMSVDVKGRVVIIDGLAISSDVRAYVSQDVWSVAGVRDVCNALQVPPWG